MKEKVSLEENEDGVYRLVVRDAAGKVVTGRRAKRALEKTQARLAARLAADDEAGEENR
jgi:uncharacterized heparinase superfamily protein